MKIFRSWISQDEVFLTQFWLGEWNRCGDPARCPAYGKFIKRTKETGMLGQAIIVNHPFLSFSWNHTGDYRSTQDSWFGLLPLLIGLGSLPGASHLHSRQEVVSRRVRSWFVWEAFLSSPALRHPLNFCKKSDSWRLQIHLNSCIQGRFDVKYLEATTPRTTTKVHLRLAWRRRDVRVLRLHATSLRSRWEKGTKCSEVWICLDLSNRKRWFANKAFEFARHMLSSFQEYIPPIVDFPSQLWMFKLFVGWSSVDRKWCKEHKRARMILSEVPWTVRHIITEYTWNWQEKDTRGDTNANQPQPEHPPCPLSKNFL